eukprot:CAMPEP_0182434550 /NCGR_PEP_ID=MMETSP1167-20130531/70392_1 /TAXON_ID=2988 /ORGANISM="Mallomonas Sp, Strain CCMP3275" /LENGTH=188 /DNA_ID=CAMNT_0024624545 /DNA_START=85 /DNA_END=651 /DNA_ORIENTATION=-
MTPEEQREIGRDAEACSMTLWEVWSAVVVIAQSEGWALSSVSSDVHRMSLLQDLRNSLLDYDHDIQESCIAWIGEGEKGLFDSDGLVVVTAERLKTGCSIGEGYTYGCECHKDNKSNMAQNKTNDNRIGCGNRKCLMPHMLVYNMSETNTFSHTDRSSSWSTNSQVGRSGVTADVLDALAQEWNKYSS